MGAEACDTFGIQLVDVAGSLSTVRDEARIFKYFQVLGNSGPAHGQGAGQLIDSDGARGQFLKDGHAGSVGKGIQSGLQVSVH